MLVLEPDAPVVVSKQLNKQHVNVAHNAPAVLLALVQTTVALLLRNSN